MLQLISLIERITGAGGKVVAWVVLPLIFATCYEVFSRYLLNAPTIWAFEAGYMAMGVHALIGAAYTLQCHSHIRIDVLYAHFPERTKALVDVTGYVVLFFPGVIWLCIGLWDYWTEAFISGEQSGQSAWNPVIWPFRLCFFAGYALLLLQGLAEVMKDILFLMGKTDHLQGDTMEKI